MKCLRKFILILFFIGQTHYSIAKEHTITVIKSAIESEKEIIRRYKKDFDSKVQSWAQQFSPNMLKVLNENKVKMSTTYNQILSSYDDITQKLNSLDQMINSSKPDIGKVKAKLKLVHQMIIHSSMLWTRYQVDYIKYASIAVCRNEDAFNLYFWRKKIDPKIDFHKACEVINLPEKERGKLCSSYSDFQRGLLQIDFESEEVREMKVTYDPTLFEEAKLDIPKTQKKSSPLTPDQIKKSAEDGMNKAFELVLDSKTLTSEEKRRVVSLKKNSSYIEKTRKHYESQIAEDKKITANQAIDNVSSRFRSALLSDYQESQPATTRSKASINGSIRKLIKNESNEDMLEVILEAEVYQLNAKGKKVTRADYEQMQIRLKDLQERVKKVKNGRELTDNVIEEILKEVFPDYLSNYHRDNPGVNGLLSGNGGNCVAESIFINYLLGKSENIGLQVFGDHLQMVKVDPEKNIVWNFMDGKVVEGVVSDIVEPNKYLLGSLLKKMKGNQAGLPDFVEIKFKTNRQSDTILTGAKGVAYDSLLELDNSGLSIINSSSGFVPEYSSAEIPKKSSKANSFEGMIFSETEPPIVKVAIEMNTSNWADFTLTRFSRTNDAARRTIYHTKDEQTAQVLRQSGSSLDNIKFSSYSFDRAVEIVKDDKVFKKFKDGLKVLKEFNGDESSLSKDELNQLSYFRYGFLRVLQIYVKNGYLTSEEIRNKSPRFNEIITEYKAFLDAMENNPSYKYRFMKNAIKPANNNDNFTYTDDYYDQYTGLRQLYLTKAQEKEQTLKDIKFVLEKPSSKNESSGLSAPKQFRGEFNTTEKLSIISSAVSTLTKPDKPTKVNTSANIDIPFEKNYGFDVVNDHINNNAVFSIYSPENISKLIKDKGLKKSEMSRLSYSYFEHISEATEADKSNWPKHPVTQNPVRPDLIPFIYKLLAKEFKIHKEVLLKENYKGEIYNHPKLSQSHSPRFGSSIYYEEDSDARHWGNTQAAYELTKKYDEFFQEAKEKYGVILTEDSHELEKFYTENKFKF